MEWQGKRPHITRYNALFDAWYFVIAINRTIFICDESNDLFRDGSYLCGSLLQGMPIMHHSFTVMHVTVGTICSDDASNYITLNAKRLNLQ